jgi:two-component system, OmpR family, response regulator
MQPALRKVIVVEDNRDIRTIVKAALEMVGGLEVLACESGAEALGAIGEFGPQLMLLDVMMPDLDGPSLLGRLRERPDTAVLPVVFLTAKAVPSEIQRLRALGALDVLTKPFDPMTLHEQVKAIWAAAVGSPSPLPTGAPIFLGPSGNID